MVAVVVAYSLINVVIHSVIQPKFVGDAVGLSVTLTFISLVIWAWVLGPLGALLAIPLPTGQGPAARHRSEHAVDRGRHDEGAELERLRALVGRRDHPAPRRSRARTGLGYVLVSLAALLAPLSVVAVWARGVGDTDR